MKGENTMLKNIDKDFIRLGALLTVTGAFWLTTMVNADAAQRYSVEDSCDYNIPKEQILDKVPVCLDAINFNIETLLMEVRMQMEQMRKARQEYNNQICGEQQ